MTKFTKTPLSLLKTPKLRFKGFEGEWEEKRLGEMFEFISGLSGLNKNNFINGNDSYLEYKDIYQKKKLYDSDGKSFNLNGTRQNAIIKNDILVTNTSETIEEIGISSIYLGNIVKYLNSFCFAIRSRTNLVFCEYINYLFGNFNFRKKIIKIGQGSTRFNMSKKEFSNILFSYGSLQKQQKIAKFFSLLDKQIELWQTKLQLNELKWKYIRNWLFYKNEYKKVNFSNFFKIICGFSFKKEDFNDNGIFNILTIKNISIKNKIINLNECNKISFFPRKFNK